MFAAAFDDRRHAFLAPCDPCLMIRMAFGFITQHNLAFAALARCRMAADLCESLSLAWAGCAPGSLLLVSEVSGSIS